MDDIDGFHWNLTPGACCAWSISFYVSNGFPSPNYVNFITYKHNTSLPSLSGGGVGDGPSLGFGGQSNTTGWVGHLQIYDNISAAGWRLATLGVCTNPQTGVTVMQCLDKLSGVAQNTYCFDHNVLAHTTVGTINGTPDNPPYPAPNLTPPAISPGCPFTPTGQFTASSYSAIGFTNLNGANGGDYTLTTSSPYHNAASDGKDLGADISVVNQKTSGVQ